MKYCMVILGGLVLLWGYSDCYGEEFGKTAEFEFDRSLNADVIRLSTGISDISVNSEKENVLLAQCCGARRTNTKKSANNSRKTETLTRTLSIQDMMCSLCASRVKNALESVKGVVRASVDFRKGAAVVQIDTAVQNEQLINAVTTAGFSVTAGALREDSATFSSIQIQVRGMTCEACASKVAKVLSAISGTSNVTVDLKQKRAALTIETPGVKQKGLVAAIKKAGFDASVIQTEMLCFRVSGMTCEQCPQRLQKALEVKGVEKVVVDFKTSIACVTSEKGKVSAAVLQEAVVKAGDSAHQFKAEPFTIISKEFRNDRQ